MRRRCGFAVVMLDDDDLRAVELCTGICQGLSRLFLERNPGRFSCYCVCLAVLLSWVLIAPMMFTPFSRPMLVALRLRVVECMPEFGGKSVL